MSGQLADFVAWAIEAFVQKVVQLASLGRQLSGLCERWQADGKLLTRLTGRMGCLVAQMAERVGPSPAIPVRPTVVCLFWRKVGHQRLALFPRPLQQST
jgi:hypothetical protein